MNLPSNPDFYAKLLVAIVIIIGAVVIQAVSGDIPTWLIGAVASVLTFFFGVSTSVHPPKE